jgi:ATP-binding cassette subfamily B protein
MSEDNNKVTAAPKPAPGRGGPMGGGMMPGEKPKNFKATMKKLLGYVRPYWFAMMMVFAFAIASTVFAIVSPKILGNMTTQVVNDFVDMKTYDSLVSQLPKGLTIPAGTKGADLLAKAPAAMVAKIPASMLDKFKAMDLTKRPEMQYAKLWQFVQLLVLLYLLSAFFSFVQGWIMTDISQKITFQLRKDISDKINRMPLKYFDTKSFGDVLSRVTNDVDTIGQTLNQSLTQIVTSVTMIIGILYMMITISWQLTLVALVTVPLSFVTIGLIVSKSQKYFKEQQASLGTINGHVEEMYGGHKIVKVFNGEKQSISIFNRINGKLYNSAWKSQFLSGLMMPLMSFFSNLGFVGVSVYGGYLAVKGTINIGDIQAFIQYVNQFNQPIMQTANIANVLQSTAAAAERVFEFLAEGEEVPESTSPVVLKNVTGNVEFDNVVFGYNKGQTIINNFTAKVASGQRIAIVGPTGAGKTTMVNLLMRFYDVNKGAIKIDGVDIREMKRADLRRMFGMVLQDTWLFHGTIRDNIAYGNLDASEAEVIAAAKAAHVDHFVHSLPNGYNMELSEEADNISQGEKQLMTIARAMLADPPMLILDEATSSVDTRTEVLIQKAMDKLMEGRTSFVIAHRLSTIRGADLILVMDKGNIVEQGKHEDLLKNNGFYAKLYNSQFTAAMTE